MNLQVTRNLACDLLKKFKLTEWSFDFDRAKKRFGHCSYRHKRITLSKALTMLNNISHIEGTLRHEIAHALTPGHHHDHIWKQKCLEIGAEPVRYFNERSNGHLIVRAQKYTYECSTCHRQWRAYKKWTRKHYCTSCSRQFGICDNRSLLVLISFNNGIDNLFAELENA